MIIYIGKNMQNVLKFFDKGPTKRPDQLWGPPSLLFNAFFPEG
jgi:hypothetical protein